MTTVLSTIGVVTVTVAIMKVILALDAPRRKKA